MSDIDNPEQRRAIVIYVDDNRHIVQQALALRESWLYARSPDTDLVVMGPQPVLSSLPDDLVKIPQEPAANDPVWQGNRYINAIACLNAAGSEQLDRYSHLLRTHADTFITPAWNQFYPDSFTVGAGAYANDDNVRQRIVALAEEYGLTHRGRINVGTTWYGPTEQVRRACAFAEMLARRLLTHEFATDEGAWPGWYRGVATKYADEIAVNHCAPDALQSDLLDHRSTSTESTADFPHIHCWHTDEKFSKHWFMAGQYTEDDARDLDIGIVRDYCMAMSFRSLGGIPGGQDTASAGVAHGEEESEQGSGSPVAEPSEHGSTTPLQKNRTRNMLASGPPLVSCLCPTFNRPPGYQYLLEEAIESFLRQDYPNKELIVLNDCPGQQLVCKAPGVRVVNVAERFPTLGDKRNALVDLARGDLLLSWDDDDVNLPWRLSLSVERLGDAGYFSPGRFWRSPASGHYDDVVEPIGHNASIFRRSAYEEAGRYPSISCGEDYELHHALNALPGCAAPNSGDRALRQSDLFYIYRLWVSPMHMSWGLNRDVEYYRQVGDRPIETGRFVLTPHWRRDYVDDVRLKIVA